METAFPCSQSDLKMKIKADPINEAHLQEQTEGKMPAFTDDFFHILLFTKVFLSY